MESLPWYIAGPLIGLMVPLLLIVREKQLGLSSSYRFLGSFVLPKNSYFNYDRSKDAWQVHFAIGIVLAAVIIFQIRAVHPSSVETHGFEVPTESIYSIKHWFIFALGGILVGFGARYADGCTAGHCIMGNSVLSKASILSTLMFFAGGLIVSHFVIPNLFES